MLDLRRLRVFRSVVVSGSVQAAASNLGYTPSAISQQLTMLQRETGLTLLERAGRGVQPTAAGLRLSDEIGLVLDQVGRTEGVIADLREGRIGSLTIAHPASVGTTWLPEILRALHQNFEGLRVTSRLSDVTPSNPSERADVEIAIDDGHPVGPGFTAHHLADDPYACVLPTTHRLASADIVALAELETERWIDNDSPHGSCRQIVIHACAAAGFHPRFELETDDYRAAIAFVATGVGITVLPMLGIDDVLDGVVVKPLTTPTPVRSIRAIVRDSVAQTPPVRLVLDALIGAASRSSPVL